MRENEQKYFWKMIKYESKVKLENLKWMVEIEGSDENEEIIKHN